MLKISKVENKRELMPLLLLGDEQASMIEQYIDDCEMFALYNNELIGQICVKVISENAIEIKNLAIYPQFQKLGYGKKLIDFVCDKYKNEYDEIYVGTGDSPLTLPFYEKCGFCKSHVIKNFFIDNYDHPIIERNVQLIDMIYLKKKLK